MHACGDAHKTLHLDTIVRYKSEEEGVSTNKLLTGYALTGFSIYYRYRQRRTGVLRFLKNI